MLKTFDIRYNFNIFLDHLEKMKTHIANGDLVLVKNAIPPEKLSEMKNQIWSWGLKQPLMKTDYSSFITKNFKMEIYNKMQQSADLDHVDEFDLFNTPANLIFYRLADLEQIAHENPRAIEVANTLACFHNKIADEEFSINWHEELKLNLEVIHYPCGGGFIGGHNHNHQHHKAKFSMILALSKRGEDFQKGATCFLKDKKWVAQEEHNQGDLLVFLSELAHKVTPCDPQDTLDFNKSEGRWTAILPLYKSAIY